MLAVLGMLGRFPTPLLIASPETGEILWVNSTLLKMAEVPASADVVGRSLFDFVLPDQVGLMLADLAKVAERKSPPTRTYRLKRSSGEFSAAQVSAVPMTFNSEPAMLCVLIDVSDRERLLVEYDDAKERYRSLVESLPVAVVVVVDERFVFANRHFLDIVGAQETEQVVGRPLLEFIAVEDQSSVRRRRREIMLAGGQPREERVRLRRIDGEEVEAGVLITRVRWEGLLATQTVVRVHPSSRRNPAE